MHVRTSQAQMSESLWTVAFLTLSGGLQDAYTYFERGKVFANAMTGNLVLMSARAFELDFSGFLRYLIPVSAFCLGLMAAALVHLHYRHSRFHWRQLIVLIEIVLLCLVPFVSEDLIANALVTFSCALQVASFRKFHGIPFSSTMCIGNMRSGTSTLLRGIHENNPKLKEESRNYFLIIFIFILGAGTGRMLCFQFGQYTILVSSLLLLCALVMMSVHPDVVETSHPKYRRHHVVRHHSHHSAKKKAENCTIGSTSQNQESDQAVSN